jgi:hypothetical protein
MLRRFASITRQGSRVKADILPGVRSVASGHSLMFPRKRHPKVKVSPDQYSTGHWAANGRREPAQYAFLQERVFYSLRLPREEQPWRSGQALPIRQKSPRT